MPRSRAWALALMLVGAGPAASSPQAADAGAAGHPAARSSAAPVPANGPSANGRSAAGTSADGTSADGRASGRAPAPIRTAPRTAQTAPAAPAPSQAATPDRREVRYRIFARGVAIGSESVVVASTPTGLTLTSTGQVTALSLVLNQAEIRYDAQGHPLGFSFDARAKDTPVRITTTFADGKATSQIIQGDQGQSASHDVSPTTIVLPNNVYGAYEAVVARLASLQPGAALRVYVAPQAEIDLTFDSVSTERVQTTARAFQSKHYQLTAQNPGGPLKIEVWADDRDRLMRVLIPQGPIDVMREDIAVVSTRQQTTFRESDEDVRVPANGFNLAATISKPATPPPPVKGKPARLPAVILVAGSGFVERDETTAGIPIFAQLAGALADAGHLVVRYDKRGVGQSGGRIESATLADYAEDVRAIVRYVAKRKDVEKDRLAVAGYTEGVAVALIAARREKKIRALVLMAGAGTTGGELLLEQQRAALDKLELPDAERQARIDLQQKIQAAAISGQGWEGIKPEVRRQADTPWFASLLQFDPGPVIAKVKAPILIVHGDLDRQVPVHHADRLATLANARKKAAPTQVARFPALNHLFAPAKTGEIDEYATLETKAVSPDVPARITEWLQATLAPKT